MWNFVSRLQTGVSEKIFYNQRHDNGKIRNEDKLFKNANLYQKVSETSKNLTVEGLNLNF